MRAHTNPRRDALAIFKAAVAAANPAAGVEAALRRRRDLHRYQNIFVVGAGKAGGAMARAAERVLGKLITAGCVNIKDGDPAKSRRIQLAPCSHPVPDQRGVAGARRIADICAAAGSRDLVLCLISGGASALMPAPADGISLEEKQETTRLLLACGATIHEINSVRKHISVIKGGQLARLSAPAHVVSLILSDVVGDELDVIGSGPTASDVSTFADAIAVLEKYRLSDRVPKSVYKLLNAAAQETPKAGDPLFENVENVLIGTNQKSLDAAAHKAKALGYRSLILSSTLQGETREVARVHAAIARQIREKGQPLKPPACVISGGETTVTIRGDGKGGRNQEFALAAAIDIAGLPGVAILSAGTDGTDGPTDAAGAFADGATLERSQLNAAESLAKNDSYPFFDALGDLIVVGPTGTNVMDLHLILVV